VKRALEKKLLRKTIMFVSDNSFSINVAITIPEGADWEDFVD
jgi:hypothetical protein